MPYLFYIMEDVMRDLEKLEEAMNAQERYLYAIGVRLNIVIEQLDSIISHIAKTDSVAVENNIVEDKLPCESPIEEVVKPTRGRKKAVK
jgi:hypothetical protein